MDYFYCPREHIRGTTFLIDGEEFSHLVHVMRKKAGDEIRIVDGEGSAFDARIEEMKKKTASGKILRSLVQHNEPALEVTLAVGVLKNPSKFDFLVEKTTELGVRRIIPLMTERTIPSHAKIDRWQKLALAAMKQCGRSFLPIVQPLTTLDELLESAAPVDLKIIAHEKIEMSEQLPVIVTEQVRSMMLLVGPEGGFSESEVEQCREAGFQSMNLGNRRLRTETAAIVVTTLALIAPASSRVR